MPVISKACKQKNIKKSYVIQNKSVEQSHLLYSRESLGLIVDSKQIVSKLYG